MSAGPDRRAGRTRYPIGRAEAVGLLRIALELRSEWLAAGLCADQADRPAAERAIAELYDRAGLAEPRFEWFWSPASAVRCAGAGRLDYSWPRYGAREPAGAVLARSMSSLRERLDAKLDRTRVRPRFDEALARVRIRSALDALESGSHLTDVIDVAVGASLRATLQDAIAAPLRTALPGRERGLGLTWYGQQDSYWIAGFDVARRLGLITVGEQDARELDLWATIARSTGWWWPGDGGCVLAERPAAIRCEPAPNSWHGELRLHCDDGPAVSFRDGFELHVLHGTPVPAWVLAGPTAELISLERSVEVRRCAIERIGWDAYLREAHLRVIGASADPGNRDAELRLYDLPPDGSGVVTRILVAVNGSPEPNGHRRRYGLYVPSGINDPLAAAAWTYGLNREQYAQLVRRT